MTENNIPILKEILEKYQFLEIHKNLNIDYKNIINNIFNVTLEEFSEGKSNLDFDLVFTKNVEEYFHKTITDQINNDSDFIVNLWNNIVLTDSPSQRLNIFTEQLNILKVTFSIDFYIDILNKIPDIYDILNKNLAKELQFKAQGNRNLINILSAYNILTQNENFNLENDMFDDEARIESDNIKIYMQEIKRYPLLTPIEAKELMFKIKQGDDTAKEKFINSNLRLVVKVAHKYASKMPFLDLVQEGNIGLLKAVDEYDPNKGFMFSTYAMWWIHQSMIRAIHNKGSIIRLPIRLGILNKKLKRFQQEFERENARLPLPTEIAEALKITPTRLKTLLEGIPQIVSAETTINEEKDSKILDFISDEVDITDSIENKIISEQLFEFLKNSLTTREFEVIYLRNVEQLSLGQIATKYELSREGIRQIEKKAIQKLRNNPNIEIFATLMDNPEESLTNVYLFRKHQNCSDMTFSEEEYKESLEKAKKRLNSQSDFASIIKKKKISNNISANQQTKELLNNNKTTLEINTLKKDLGGDTKESKKTYIIPSKKFKYDYDEIKNLLKEILNNIDYQILNLYLEGTPITKIASALGITENFVYKSKTRSILSLKEYYPDIEEYFIQLRKVNTVSRKENTVHSLKQESYNIPIYDSIIPNKLLTELKSELSEKEYQIIIGHYLNNYTDAEMAYYLHVTVNNIYKTRTNALHRLNNSGSKISIKKLELLQIEYQQDIHDHLKKQLIIEETNPKEILKILKTRLTSDEYRFILDHYIEGKKLKELGEVYNCSLAKIRNIRDIGLKKLTMENPSVNIMKYTLELKELLSQEKTPDTKDKNTCGISNLIINTDFLNFDSAISLVKEHISSRKISKNNKKIGADIFSEIVDEIPNNDEMPIISDREKVIISLNLGLIEGKNYSLSQLADLFNEEEQYITNITEKALVVIEEYLKQSEIENDKIKTRKNLG